MPQRPAMAKHLRQTRKRTYRNRLRRDAMREAVRQTLEAARAGDTDSAQLALQDAQKAIDKAAQRGVIHRNRATRQKSRLTAQVRDLLAAQQQPAD